jgi:ATP-dependent Lon protease
MELIEVPGYTRSDKRNIARQFLVPKQLDQHGLTKDQLEFLPEGIDTLIDFYTREAGVRGLEREVAAVARHATVRIAEGQSVQGERVDRAHVENVLGTHRYRPEVAERQLRPGVSTGLGTSDSGGELLIVEATRMPGTGDIRLTGNLRNVMTEAAQTAVSLVRSRSERLGLDTNWIEKVDLHVHIPRARAVRDAAGAGLPIFVAIISLLYGAPTRSDVALVGEVTLRGRVLPVSHLKDQVLAAHRADVRQVVIPSRNQRDLEEVPREILDEIQVHLVDRVEDALQWVLISPPLQDLKSSDTVASDDTGGPGHLEDRAEPNAESEPPRSGGSVASVATRCKAP